MGGKPKKGKSMSELTDKMENMSMNDSTSLGKSSVSSGAPKTPVSLLQELYVRKGITPKYDLVQIEGAVHEPTFKYRVTIGEFVASGCGQSKKKAKHSAAKAILDKVFTTLLFSDDSTMICDALLSAVDRGAELRQGHK